MVIVDTDVLINYLKNKPQAVADLSQIGWDEVLVTSMTVMELYKGVRNKQELDELKQFLQGLEIAVADEEAGRLAMQWAEQYCLSHAPIDIPDLTNGAIAVLEGLKLHTDNKKHFRHLPGLRLWEP